MNSDKRLRKVQPQNKGAAFCTLKYCGKGLHGQRLLTAVMALFEKVIIWTLALYCVATYTEKRFFFYLRCLP